jgi:hypothetical protein
LFYLINGILLKYLQHRTAVGSKRIHAYTRNTAWAQQTLAGVTEKEVNIENKNNIKFLVSITTVFVHITVQNFSVPVALV